MYVASNQLRLRGGASGLAVYNTSAASILDVTDAGYVTASSFTASGGVSANYVMYVASNQLRLRGGTSGLMFHNTSAASLLEWTDAGLVTVGPASGLTSPHIVQNSSTTSGNFVLNLKKLSTVGATASTFYLAFTGSNDVRDGYIGNNGSAVLTLTDESDVRVKENIRPATYGLETIKALRPVLFDWIGSNVKNVKGFIAQEVKEVLPESVTVVPTEQFDDMHYLETQTMIPILVKAVQELSAKNDALQARIEALEAQ
jgi:hypothetical protein